MHTTIRTKKGLMWKAFYSLVAIQAIALVLFPLSDVFAATYSITVDPATPSGMTVNIQGTVNVEDGAGSGASQYDVQVLWDSTGDTNNKSDTSPHSFTPASGNKTFSGTWSNSHTYSTPGTYTIKVRLYHQNPPGNDGQSSQTATIQVTVAAPPTTGTLTVNKVVNGGTAATSSFALFVDGSSVTSGVSTTTTAGAHVVSEATTTDYVGVFSGDCDINGNVTVSTTTPAVCTITNTFTGSTSTPATSTTGAIIVNKVVLDPNGATTTDQTSFSISLNGTSTTSISDSSPVTFADLTPGQYVLTEAAIAGYDLFSINPSATTTVVAGATTTITVVNKQQATSTPPVATTTPAYVITIDTPVTINGLTVDLTGTASTTNSTGNSPQYDVQLLWDDGSTTDSNPHVFSPSTGDFMGTWGTSTHTYAAPGTYTIMAKLYHGSVSGNDGDATTTVQVILTAPTSTPATTTGSLTVNKIVSGGTATTSDFSLFLDGNLIVSGVATTTSMGAHVVTEATSTNYIGVFSGDCDSNGNVNVSTSTPAVCILTNTFTGSTSTPATSTTGAIIVNKVVLDPNGATTTDQTSFSISLNGTSTKAISDSSPVTYADLLPGQYVLSEATSSGYDFVTISPSATTTVIAGATTTLTLVNQQQRPVPPPPSGGGGSGDNLLNPNAATAVSSGGGGGGSTGGGQVLGASTDPGPSCGAYISTYMRKGKPNNSSEVRKLQQFLNEFVGTNLPITGFFGVQTDAAVKAFQLKYANEILGPWVDARLHPSRGLATGYVYKTTLRWINLLKCSSLNIPVPQLP